MLNPKPTYSRLPAAVTQELVESTPFAHSDDVVKTILLNISSELLAFQCSTNLLGAMPKDCYIPSLQVLHMRLEVGLPTPFPGFVLDNEKVPKQLKKTPHNSTQTPSIKRPLGDFEDLYYAMLAAVKAMHESLVLRLDNGFNDPKTQLFPGSEYTMCSFVERLHHQWEVLNVPPLVLALDKAVRRSFIDHHLHEELLKRVVEGKITHHEAEEARTNLFEADTFVDLPGLNWIGDEHSGMINGRLNEKYRALFYEEKKAQEKRRRWRRKSQKTGRSIRSSNRMIEQNLEQSREMKRKKTRHAAVNRPQQPLSPYVESFKAYLQSAKTDQSTDRESWQPERVAEIHGETRPSSHDTTKAWPVSALQRASLHPREAQMRHRNSSETSKMQPSQGIKAGIQLQHAGTGAMSPTASRIHHEVAPITHRLQRNFITQVHDPHLCRGLFAHTGVQGLLVNQESVSNETIGRQVRMQRVSEYREWLRKLAGEDVRRFIYRTNQSQ